MSPRDYQLRVQDILDAIATIQSYTAGMDFPAFAQDRRTVDAVLRNITVIGEAATRIPAAIQVASPEIPWADTGDMRNVVVHEYFGVNRRILWDTSRTDLPPAGPPTARASRPHAMSCRREESPAGNWQYAGITIRSRL